MFVHRPYGNYTVNIVPEVSQGCGSVFGVIIDSSIREVGVVATNVYIRPLFSSTGIINIAKRSTIIEYRVTNIRH